MPSPPVKLNGYANGGTTSQAQNAINQRVNHGNGDANKIINDHYGNVDHLASEVSNGYAGGHTNGHAQGTVKANVKRYVNSHVDSPSNGHCNGHTQAPTNDNPKDIPYPNVQPEKPPAVTNDKYRHVMAVHNEARTSCLSHDSPASPSFLGFRNLMVLVLSTCL